MKPSHLVPILAEIFVVPQDVAAQIDRAVANAGFRKKGKGRAIPDITRREGVHFMLACQACDKASDVESALKTWSSATANITDKRFSSEKYEHSKQINSIIDMISDEDAVEDEDDFMISRINNLPFLKNILGKELSLVDYLVYISNYVDFERLEIELDTTNLIAAVRYHIKHGKYDEEVFWTKEYRADAADLDNKKRVIISVPGEWLAAVAARTEPEELDLG